MPHPVVAGKDFLAGWVGGEEEGDLITRAGNRGGDPRILEVLILLKIKSSILTQFPNCSFYWL
jgi:hypothetical protein